MFGVSARRLLAVAVTLQLTIPANAASVKSVSDWAQELQTAISASDFDAMTSLVEGASDPRVDAASMIKLAKGAVSGKTFLYAEQFNNQSLGTFFKRVNFAVIYKEGAIFYSFEFARNDAGWRILGVAADGNVNNILARQWPP